MLDTLDPGTDLDPAPRAAMTRDASERLNRVTSVPFFAMHLLPLVAIFTGVTPIAVVLFVVLFWGRMFCITAGYHRYFSHRSYKMGRVLQFLMAFGGTTAVQKGPLWWAGNHRHHHRNSDTEADLHSPLKGFWWSHVGWILCDKHAVTDLDRIRDFAKYPELRFLNRFDWIGPWALGFACWFIGGWSGLFFGFFGSTVLLWHATFTVNSLAHVFGRRRYATEDTSRNSALIALLTMGEGWHNNHHSYQASARQGFFWWEIDVTYYILRAMSWVGLVHDLKAPPRQVLEGNRVKDGSFDIGMFRSHWIKASRSVHAAQSSLGQRMHDRRVDTAEVIAARRESAEHSLAAGKAALEGFVHHSLESAEELAKLRRSTERELGLADA
jgi:stearoyl-CoA desaturase (Delta-9 desaturase)